MKTLVLIAHPNLQESGTEEFLKTSVINDADVTWHPLMAPFDLVAERRSLRAADRIIFQFPLYWYHAPALLAEYQEAVFDRHFIDAKEQHALMGKELGIVVTTGKSARQFTSGGSESVTIDELMRPYQAFAASAGMIWLPIMAISQFQYLTEAEKLQLVTDYRRQLLQPKLTYFDSKEQWFLDQLAEKLTLATGEQKQQLNLVLETLRARQMERKELADTLALIRQDEDEE